MLKGYFVDVRLWSLVASDRLVRTLELEERNEFEYGSKESKLVSLEWVVVTSGLSLIRVTLASRSDWHATTTLFLFRSPTVGEGGG